MMEYEAVNQKQLETKRLLKIERNKKIVLYVLIAVVLGSVLILVLLVLIPGNGQTVLKVTPQPYPFNSS